MTALYTTGVVRQLTNTANFIATPMKKHISSSFYQRVFFRQFVDRKVMGLVPKYYLLAANRSQVSISFLT